MKSVLRLGISLLLGCLLPLSLLVSPASAASPKAAVNGDRVVVKFTGKRPSKVTMKVAGSKYRLKRSGKVWRTKTLSAAQLTAITGATAKIIARIKGKTRTFSATVNGTTPTTLPTTPGPGPAQPLFVAPGVDRTGSEAWEAVKGYFADSTLTDCTAGWPNCAVEERYAVFADGTHWYCRLTPTSGSDIRAVGSIAQIVGAEQKADGAWGVSFALNSYGNTTYYTHRVAANGSATLQYWGPGVDVSGPPSEVKTGLNWLRGAKDCSY
jgi:hypothetical protein